MDGEQPPPAAQQYGSLEQLLAFLQGKGKLERLTVQARAATAAAATPGALATPGTPESAAAGLHAAYACHTIEVRVCGGAYVRPRHVADQGLQRSPPPVPSLPHCTTCSST